MEAMIIYFRDDLVRTNIGHGADGFTTVKGDAVRQILDEIGVSTIIDIPAADRARALDLLKNLPDYG